MQGRSAAGATRTGSLALGALGIVYGDIGTSPLYALRESFEGAGHELPVTEANVLGVLSLVLWSLVLVVSVKYLGLVLRADNEGEGGILALTSLLPAPTRPAGTVRAAVLLGLFGTALLYGDGMITPAISVLAAVEGTAVVAPSLAPYAAPVAAVILVGVFAIQSRGTEAVGRAFGPVMLVWFGVLGLLGLVALVADPSVLAAANPAHAVRFFAANGLRGVLVLGSVVLVVTGGEALYADLGHFGRRPITVGWFAVALPGLALNYLGQGALLLGDATAIDNPFYRLAPGWARFPLLLLATAATVIASQALISGAFSLTMQAVQFGYLPRLRVVHTSAHERGQVYVPVVNWGLMVACVALVVGFGSTSGLAAAYGVAVTATMAITTVLFGIVARTRFGWSRRATGLVCAPLLVVDLAFFVANLPKVPHGGWFPLVVGAVVLTVLTTWSTGRRLLRERTRRGRTPLAQYVESLLATDPPRVPGTAVHLFGTQGVTPPSLQRNVRTNHVLHTDVVVATVVTERVPKVPPARRVTEVSVAPGVRRVTLHYGFAERPDLPSDLRDHAAVEPRDSTYFLGRETVVPGGNPPGMAPWRERLFALLRRNATSTAAYYGLPLDRVVELGARVAI